MYSINELDVNCNLFKIFLHHMKLDVNCNLFKIFLHHMKLSVYNVVILDVINSDHNPIFLMVNSSITAQI
jgi:hypothetical protein